MTVTADDSRTWPTFATVPEAAEILRVSKMTIYRMVHRGDFGPEGTIRVGRGFRIKKEALNKVVAEGTSAVNPEDE
jgi:excisionase family DNA binding protein